MDNLVDHVNRIDAAPDDAADAAAAQLRDRLAGFPGFGPEDLQCNRDGTLSADQRQRLLDDTWRDITALIVTVIFAGFWLAAQGFAVIPSLIMAAVIGYQALRIVADRSEIRHERPRVCEGHGTTRIVHGDESPDEYYLDVDDRELKLSRDLYEALESGGPYRVWFLLESRRVVAVEVLPGWKPAPPEPPRPDRQPSHIEELIRRRIGQPAARVVDILTATPADGPAVDQRWS